MRYHWDGGPEVVPPAGLPSTAGPGGNTDGSYYPLTFGFRF